MIQIIIVNFIQRSNIVIKTRNNNCNQHQGTISMLANCITIMMEPKGNKKAKGFNDKATHNKSKTKYIIKRKDFELLSIEESPRKTI